MLPDNAALAAGFSRADAILRRRLEGPLKAAHGIGFTEFRILAELDGVQGGRLRAGDLAGRLALTAGGITRAAAPLAQSDLLQRRAHERDARAAYLAITPQGRERVEQAANSVDALVGEFFAGLLTRTDRLALLGLFERLNY